MPSSSSATAVRVEINHPRAALEISFSAHVVVSIVVPSMEGFHKRDMVDIGLKTLVKASLDDMRACS
jgi:hypothetical protein